MLLRLTERNLHMTNKNEEKMLLAGAKFIQSLNKYALERYQVKISAIDSVDLI